MSVFKQMHPDDVQGAVDKIKIADAEVLSDKRKELLAAYAQLPGGPVGVRIVNEKAFQEFKEKSTSDWVKGALEDVKQKADAYGVVPLKWFYTSTRLYGVSDTVAASFLLKAQRAGVWVKEPFQPKNKEELNFFIGEAAYFSHIYSKEFYHAMKYSGTTVHFKDLSDWYNERGKELRELKFSGDDRAKLLRYGMTAKWINKLELSDEEAIATVNEFPWAWREKQKRVRHY
jgi:hypothetical protein